MPAAEHSLADDLALMRALALEAGKVALSWRRSDGSVRGWDKPGAGGPVTQADMEVNHLCFTHLTGARPDYGWLSEETPDDAVIRARSRVWVVDPIDGTRAYMNGRSDWCIALALIEEGKVVGAIVHAPLLGRIYEARRGHGAFLNGEAIRVSARRTEEGARLIGGAGILPAGSCLAADGMAPRPSAKQLRLAMVSSAEWDGVLILSSTADWDVAAGALLVEEAGGRVTTHEGDSLRFNCPVPRQKSVVASGNGLHPLLLRRARGISIPDPQARGMRRPG